MGIPYSADMDDMTIKLRLMEARIADGRAGGAGPATRRLRKAGLRQARDQGRVDRLYNKGDINGANIFMEYINDPQQAKNRYGKEAAYRGL